MDDGVSLGARQARLEIPETGRIELYLGYEYAEYQQEDTPDGWWHRTLTLHPHHWLRLSGDRTIEPWNAFQSILANPDRSPIPLPPLLVALFLAQSPDPNVSEQRQVFQWVAYAVRELLAILPLSARHAGWNEIASDQLDDLAMAILDALLHQKPTLPWPQLDGVEVQILSQMADILWAFPPTLTRQIPQVAAMYFEQRLEDDRRGVEDEDLLLEDEDPISITRWSLLGNLAAIRFWRTPLPTIRGLSVQAPMHEILFIWYQALVIMHPDAPIIDDADLAWLCDGVLGALYDAPFSQLLAAQPVIDTLNIPVTESQKRIAALQQNVAQGMCLPEGRWEIPVSNDWLVVRVYGAAAVRLVAGPDGCWVRLIPAQWGWGSVLWWRPQSKPPTCWTLAFGDDLASPYLLSLHEALWEVWRDLCLHGRPIRGSDPGGT